MLAIAVTIIGAFCPYLAQHTDVLLQGIDTAEQVFSGEKVYTSDLVYCDLVTYYNIHKNRSTNRGCDNV